MPTPGENEVEILQQNPLGNEPPDLPPYPSAPEPEPEPSGNLGSDSQPNLPPPTYEEAIDPTFMQRFQKFTPQWPGFHPAEAPRLARQMTRQMSRNNPDPENETGETSQEEEKNSCCFTVFFTFGTIVMFLAFICLLLAPPFMIGVGGSYYEQCDQTSPYPMWLIVGGVSTIVAGLFVCCLVCSDTDNCCLYMLGVLLLAAPVIWFFFGCYYVWGIWTRHSNWDEFQSSDCVYPYYFSYALVVSPFGLLGLMAAMFCLTMGYAICCEED